LFTQRSPVKSRRSPDFGRENSLHTSMDGKSCIITREHPGILHTGGPLRKSWPDAHSNKHAILVSMLLKAACLLLGVAAIFCVLAFRNGEPVLNGGPAYTSDGRLELPEHYREWIYLSSGFDMSYNPAAKASGHHMFDNVFVNPEAYRTFVETGTWPDGAMLMLENRGAEGRGSINQSGNYQSTDVMGLEVHVKDSARFADKWAFFGFSGRKPAKVIPHSAECYSCHAEHAAVDTTFVQFYPTLLPVAKSKHVLSAGYVKETGSGR
jgi:Cytochrome P460